MTNLQTDSPATLAVVSGLRVEFGPVVAVDDVSFELHAGDLVGLIGPNGAGKTTLLRAMCGLQPPTAGDVHVMGCHVFGREGDVRRHIGFAPDFPPLYDELTVHDFLIFIARSYGLEPEAAEEHTDFWLEQLWLSDRRQEKIGKLSRGMRQRVTVARTLIPNPNVILLDEPSAGLDPAGRIQFRQVLADLRDQHKALIVSSHILADLEEYCTHIAIIEHGRFLRFGRVKELHDRAVGRCRYRLVVAQAVETVEATIAAVEGVSDLRPADGGWMLEFDDAPERAAELLKKLVRSGVPVASFAPLDETLEQVYLRSGVKQVD